MTAMSIPRELRVKTGAEYWRLVEKTARRVASWPEWKTGEPAIVPPPETNENRLVFGEKPTDPSGGSAPKR